MNENLYTAIVLMLTIVLAILYWKFFMLMSGIIVIVFLLIVLGVFVVKAIRGDKWPE